MTLEGVIQLQGDIINSSTPEQIIVHFDNSHADLVVCNGVPDATIDCFEHSCVHPETWRNICCKNLSRQRHVAFICSTENIFPLCLLHKTQLFPQLEHRGICSQ